MPIRTETDAAADLTLPQHYYLSDRVFAAEQHRIFWNHWFCVGRREKLVEPGDFLRADVAGQPIICTLDEAGQLRAFYDTCRHRGTRLTTTDGGRFPNARIQCAYHHWTYSCQGELLAAPRMNDTPGFCKADWPLAAVSIESWQGMVWLNLAENPRSLADTFAPFLHHFDPWQLAQLRTVHTAEYQLRANWKLVMENFSECYHCPSIHPGLAQLSSPTTAENDFTDGLLLGGPMQLTRGSMTTTGERCCDPLPTLSPQDRQRTYYYTLFPNALFGLHPDFVIAWQLYPQAPDRTRIVCQWLFDGELLDGGACDPAGAIEFWERTNRQDWDICERSHEGIASRGYQPGPLAANEVMVRAMDRLIRSALSEVSSPEGV